MTASGNVLRGIKVPQPHGRQKMQKWKMWHQNARVENAGPTYQASMESQPTHVVYFVLPDNFMLRQANC